MARYPPRFIRDRKGECVMLRDEHGETLFHLHELSGRVLTAAMLEGLIVLLERYPDPRARWRQLRAGRIQGSQRCSHPCMRRPVSRKPKRKPPKPKRLRSDKYYPRTYRLRDPPT